MYKFWNYHGPVWKPEGEGQGDGTPGGEGAPSGEASGSKDGAPAGAGDPPAGEGGDPPARSSIMDFAPKGEAPKGGDAWKLPDDLVGQIDEHLIGTTAEDTIAKLAKQNKGFRQDLSSKRKADGVLEGSVPADVDGYKFEGDPETDPVLKDLTSEESKPAVDAFRKAAMEIGIPDKAFAQFMHQGIKNMEEAGIKLAGDPEQAAAINGDAQLAALVDDLGQNGADQLLRQLDTYTQKLADKGILTSEADVREFGQMVGTADAARIFQRILVAEFGEQAIPPGDPIDGAPTMDEAQAMMQQAMSLPNPSDRQEAVERAETALAKAMRAGSTQGQVRSRVL